MPEQDWTEIMKRIAEDPYGVYAEQTSYEWGLALVNLIPQRMQPGLVRYILLGIRPGDFLCAVLQGDLFGAFGRADFENQTIMKNYVEFLHNYAPSGSFGNEFLFQNWMKRNGALGIEREGS